MAEPSKKDEGLEQSLQAIFGHDRRLSIKLDECIPPPVGCGGPATEFRDELSKKEYKISGLCQKCQDTVFPPPDEIADW